MELQPGVWVESGNAVWFDRDWADVPVRQVSAAELGLSGSPAAAMEAAGAQAAVAGPAADAGGIAHESIAPDDPTSRAEGSADDDLGDAGEPPPGWEDTCRSWVDDVPATELGPVSWLDALAPSSQLMAELENLPADLVDSDYDSVEMVAHWARLAAYCAAKEREAAAALARRELMAGGLADLGHLGITVSQPNIAGDELALRLGIGKRAAVRMMNAGRAMNGVAGPTAAALEAGEIDAVKADIIALGVEDLSPDAALAVQEAVLAKASHLPSGSVRRELAAARAKVDPAAFEDRCAEAAKTRRVDRPRVLPDGMASIYAILPAAGANQVYRAVDAAARSSKATGDERTLDQLRADALALLGAAAIDTGWIGTPPRDGCDGDDPQSVADPHADGPDRPAADRHTHERHRQTASTPGHEPEQPAPSASPPAAGERAGQPADGSSASSRAPREQPGGSAPAGTGPAEMDPRDAAAWAAASAGVCPPSGVGMRVGQIGGKSAHIRVVISLTSLMGGPDGPGADPPGADEPAHLEGYGPIPASTARALAAGGPWARMVTDPVDRSVLELTTDRYEPPAAMAALVRAAQPECIHPICSVPSDSCDLNHRVPWPAGITSARQLDPECRRDHLLVTHAGWSYTLRADGGRTWTTPTGHVYTEQPDGTLSMQTRDGSTGSMPSAPRYPTDDDPPPY